MKEAITLLVRGLVDHPEAVVVEAVPSNRPDIIRLQVHVAPQDTGKIIGKKGRVAAAIRAIGRAAAARQKKRGFIEIVS